MMKLFSIQVTHEYWGWKTDKSLSIQVTEETESLLRQYGFWVNEVEGVKEIYSNEQRDQLSSYWNYLQQTTGQKELVFNLIPSNPDFYYYTDLPNDFLGRYLFSSIGNAQQQEQVLELKQAKKEAGDFSYFAQVRIHFQDLLTPPVQYEIVLNSRVTRWEYYIINKSGVNLNVPQINEVKGVAFRKEEPLVLENGQEAIPFKMNGTCPLTEKVLYQFDLTDLNRSESELLSNKQQEKVIFKGLPNPKPSELKIIPIPKGSDVSSPMYIYV